MTPMHASSISKTWIVGILAAGLCCEAPLAATTGSVVAEAETSDLSHSVGRVEGDGWSATVATDAAGILCSGPNATNIPTGTVSATFRIMAEKVAATTKIATIDVYDAKKKATLTSRELFSKDFFDTKKYQDFTLSFSNPVGSVLEFRVQWHDLTYVKLDKVFARKTDSVVLLVSSQAATQLKPELEQYKTDVESRFPVTLAIREGDWKTPLEIRTLIKSLHTQSGVSGFVLVGALPMHRYYMHEFANPNPLYYEDYDLPFTDTNKDGFDDTYIGEPKLKVWVSNLRAVTDPANHGVTELKAFFAKTHQYYLGNQTIERRSLSVAGSDWQGSAAWFAQTYAKPILGDLGDVLDAPKDTKTNIISSFTAHPYTLFRFWAHSDQTSTGVTDGDFSADEMFNIPNKSLITFHLGCHAANWLQVSPKAKNNAQSWVFGKGIGQAAIGNVRTGTFYGEDECYKGLAAGQYMGKAYLAAKIAGEKEMFGEYPNGTVVAGNLLLGNPFLQVAHLTPIPQPVVKPNHVAIDPTSISATSRSGWAISRTNRGVTISSPMDSWAKVTEHSVAGKGLATLYTGPMSAGSQMVEGELPTGANLVLVRDHSGKILHQQYLLPGF